MLVVMVTGQWLPWIGVLLLIHELSTPKEKGYSLLLDCVCVCVCK